MSNSNIMSVREMIDLAFGDPRGNAVDHKLIQTILYLLARQLRMLERYVKVEIGPMPHNGLDTSLSITELKIHAMQKITKMVRAPQEKAKYRNGSAGSVLDIYRSASRVLSTGEGREYSEKDIAPRVDSARETRTKDSSAIDYTASGTAESPGPSLDKSHSVQTTPYKTKESDKSSAAIQPAYKTSSDKIAPTVTQIDVKSPSLKDIASTDKTLSIITSRDRISSAVAITSSDKTSTAIPFKDMTSLQKTASEVLSANKTTMGSTDKTIADRTFSDKSSTDKTTSHNTSIDKKSKDKLYPDKTSSYKTSTDRTSIDVISTDKVSSYNKDNITSRSSSTGNVTSLKRPTTDRDGAAKRKPGDYRKLLETIEERREKELRVIRQRTDSFVEPGKIPTPMASLDSVEEAKYEKLLVVERIPSDEAATRAGADSRRRRPQLSMVTKEEFDELQEEVGKLQLHLAPIPTPEFPDNAQLMEDLRKGASLTDAMAALQLSARLDATEKTLSQMLSIVTDLASKSSRIDLTAPRDETRIIFGPSSGLGTGGDMDATASTGAPSGVSPGKGADARGGVSAGASSGAGAGKSPSAGKSTVAGKGSLSGKSGEDGVAPRTGMDAKGGLSTGTSTGAGTNVDPPAKVIKEKTPKNKTSLPSPTTSSAQLKELSLLQPKPLEEEEGYAIDTGEKVTKRDCVTYEELNNAMQELYDELMKKVTSITQRSTIAAENAFEFTKKIDVKLNSALNLGNRITDLEALIGDYAEQINILDTSLSSQMTNYQEHLTQMQHELETGLETMAEILANTGGDTVAVTELNTHFNNLQLDLEYMVLRQKELKIDQNSLSLDLEALWKQIELMRESKPDREEVVDALRDKAGIGALNGLVSLLQFEAVRGDFEKRIGAAYDKFNNQEIVWQKVIDELLRELNEKADGIQIVSLRTEINKHLNALRSRLNAMLEVVGEPRAAAITRKLHQDAACLSCSTPAHMNLEEPVRVAALPAFQGVRQPAVGAEATTRLKEDGDHGLCYRGLLIPHTRDPRSHVCQRYCGGSHTLLRNTMYRVPPGITIHPASRPIATGPGTDGKIYMLDETVNNKVPCLPCNLQKTTKPLPLITIKRQETKQTDDGSDSMTPLDFRLTSHSMLTNQENFSETPPLPLDED